MALTSIIWVYINLYVMIYYFAIWVMTHLIIDCLTQQKLIQYITSINSSKKLHFPFSFNRENY